MQLYFYKSNIGNFGDDLNEWLWSKLLSPELFQREDDISFIGIGTILFQEFLTRYPPQKHKVVFGTGLRLSTLDFQIDETWDIRFLRGPISAKIATGDDTRFITDSAYCIRLLPSYRSLDHFTKEYKISLMPYYKSMQWLDWQKVCQVLGLHFIDPCAPQGVNFVLEEIAKSSFLITEAMHGAILADALRIPWSRFRYFAPHFEKAEVSEHKWTDWTSSMELKNQFQDIPFKRNKLSEKRIMRKLLMKKLDRYFKQQLVIHHLGEMLDHLDYSLSSDRVIEEKLEAFQKEVTNVLATYL